MLLVQKIPNHHEKEDASGFARHENPKPKTRGLRVMAGARGIDGCSSRKNLDKPKTVVSRVGHCDGSEKLDIGRGWDEFPREGEKIVKILMNLKPLFSGLGFVGFQHTVKQWRGTRSGKIGSPREDE